MRGGVAFYWERAAGDMMAKGEVEGLWSSVMRGKSVLGGAAIISLKGQRIKRLCH